MQWESAFGAFYVTNFPPAHNESNAVELSPVESNLVARRQPAPVGPGKREHLI